jgi:diacylglycerol kinase (ATP)
MHRSPNLIASFRFAFAGLATLLRTQRNFRIHVAVAIAVIVAGSLFRVQRWEWCVLLLCCSHVLVLEALNTALESHVDLAAPEIHPLARKAKDVAAASVLIASLFSLTIGLIILGPHFAAWLTAGPATSSTAYE